MTAGQRSDWCQEEVKLALSNLQSVLRGEVRHTAECEGEETQYSCSEELMIALDRLEDMVTSLQFDKSQVSVWRASLEAVLRSVPPCPPALSERARLALQELVRARLAGVRGPALNSALEKMLRTTRAIRSQISESEKEAPLDRMISAAEAGHEAAVTRYSQIFTEHALKLLEVADLACRMGEEREGGVAKVREAASVLECLYRQASNSEPCKYSQSPLSRSSARPGC